MPPNRQIWKYPLDVNARTNVFSMPANAEPLHVAVQRGQPMLWARVNPELQATSRTFRIVATGSKSTDASGKYIGTVMLHEGELVFHIFDGAF